MARWSLAVGGPPLSFDEVFASDGDVVLDIGFGGGEALIEMAELRPLEHVIGVDVHTPGVAAVLEAIEARGMRNVRVVEGDVIELFDRIPPASLSAVRIFFPDPWPKRRQRGRRLVRPDVMSRMVPLVRALGTIHIVTDCSNYAVQIAHVCGDHAGLVGGVVDRPH
ncbi:MAG TPA: methyltransferase domain-containing protein, partial [Ilumatobacteraceae bacterium]